MDLTFIKTTPAVGEAESWRAQFVAQTNVTVVQVQRPKGGALIVSTAIEGMEFVPIQSFKESAPANLIFEVNTPAGLKVLVESFSEVTKAKTHNG